MARGFPYL